MLSDIEIAQQATLLPIKEVAAQIGITEDELEFYGFNGEQDSPDGEEWTKKGGYITKDSDGQTEERATTVYTNDPNTHQFWPIFQSTITNSQGALVNDYGYNK